MGGLHYRSLSNLLVSPCVSCDLACPPGGRSPHVDRSRVSRSATRQRTGVVRGNPLKRLLEASQPRVSNRACREVGLRTSLGPWLRFVIGIVWKTNV